jgi:mannan endo-1,4-beta-mannosidase
MRIGVPGLTKWRTRTSESCVGPGTYCLPRSARNLLVARGATFAAVAVTLLMAVTGCLTPLTSQQPLRPVPTPASPLVGVYEPGAPGSWSQIAEFTNAARVKPRIVVYYSPWNEPFSTSFAQTAWGHDAYVLVELQPNGVTLASIAAGGSDAYLRSYADAIVAFGQPVILSFGHEMNGTWYSWGAGHTPAATFVAAWRHVVRIFRAAGAANVTWLWTVNSIAGAASSLTQWWPGAAWVDWIGIDGYYFRATDTFGSVFGSTIADIRTFSNAPLLIAETAVGTTPDRDSQIDALFAGVQADHLAGVVWFDEAQHFGLYHQDWRLEDDPSALAAFAAAAATHLPGG